MNQRNDLGARTPGDWLAEVREGESWGFPACYGQGGSACTGVPKPIAVLDKHAAAGGLTVMGGDALVSEWQLGVVKRVSLASGRVETYLSGLKNPLALATTRDGALLVGDWGSGRVYTVTDAG